MKHNLILLSCVLLFISQGIFGQKTITGVVRDPYDEPLRGVSVCQGNLGNCILTDEDGVFRLTLIDNIDYVLLISFTGYQMVKINSIDTLQSTLYVNMEPYFVDSDNFMDNLDPSEKGWGFTSSFQIDGLKNDFSQFLEPLGDYNINFMNKTYAFTSFDFAATYNRYQAGLMYGTESEYSEGIAGDSLDADLNSLLFGLSLGYKLIDSRRIVLMPGVALKWYRYRLINSDKDRKIPLSQYISDRDLDIRFNQTALFLGTSLGYKIYNNFLFVSDYWTIGVYGGYLIKLNEDPWIYSERNRLVSDRKIDMSKLNAGIRISFNID